ncbi:Abi family protein [Chitinophaga sp. MM2321]|uniref:Abi family protein n=1 Tax=Chitinophaga sp. MM2321 TaxID=3137178 RepID=UPI0032D59828
MTTPYTKPSTSTSHQIALLQRRGLTIDDPLEAEHYLKHIGYYRLAGYWQIFQNDAVTHTFIPGSTFEQIAELYNFDRELRILLLNAIERIEVSFRSVLVNEMCSAYHPAWFTRVEYAFSEEVLDKILKTIDKELSRSNEDFVAHHDRKYGTDKYPPAWKTMQVLSFGVLSKIYGNIHKNVPEKKKIAKIYGLPSEAWMHSWMQVISVLRNYCAHHSRVCYRIFSFPPKDMRRPQLPWIKNAPPTGGPLSQHLYYQLCAVRYLLHTCCPDNHFNDELRQLIIKSPGVELNRMGFIPEWEHEDLWQ